MTSFHGKRGRDSADLDESDRYHKVHVRKQAHCETHHHWVMPSGVVSQEVVMRDVQWMPRVDTSQTSERFHSVAPRASFKVLPRAVEPPSRASVRFNWQDSPPMYTFQTPAPNRWETARPQESYYRPAQIPASDSSCYKSRYADEPYVPRRRRGWELREIAVKKFKEALPALAVVATLVGWAGVLLSRH